MVSQLWQPSTIHMYKSRWKTFANEYIRDHGEQPHTRSNFIRFATSWMMQITSKAIAEHNLYYEELNDKTSCVSGTINRIFNVIISEDPAVTKLRERAKTVLLRRLPAKISKECIDIHELLHAINDQPTNEKLSLKDLRGKLATLMIIDEAVRPSTLQAILYDEYDITAGKYGDVLSCTPLVTKDKHLAKDKTKKPIKFQEFKHNQKICTVATFKDYMDRTQTFPKTQDITYANIVNGRPSQSKGCSMFIGITKPHASLATTTIAGEIRKYITKIYRKINAKEIRKATPSIIQFINKTSDDDIAQAFRWNRTSTYATWYKHHISEKIKTRIKTTPTDIPKH
mmetsp:Transcript_5770/g.9039  ORF Transcript_5770/g.9039 Transcript_5770/m.9039 type:complete len:341 (-) Transcript_5770:258-1280(-)